MIVLMAAYNVSLRAQVGKATLLARKAVLDQVLEESRLEFVELRQQEVALIVQLGSHPIPDNNIPTPDMILQMAAAAADPAGPASPSTFPGAVPLCIAGWTPRYSATC